MKFLSILLLVGYFLPWQQCLSAEKKISAFPLTPEWADKIREIAPASPATPPQKNRQVLIFSLATGVNHWCIPHTATVVEILGEKSGAYKSVRSIDIEEFLPENLGKYDAIVLNNNCPTGKDRDVFRDVLLNKMENFGGKYVSMPLNERMALAQKLYASLVAYVAEGGGLVLLHGAITNFNYSEEFSSLVGGSFNFHPIQQNVTLRPVNPEHPLLKPFGGKPFIHFDEPYFFIGAYDQLNFHPLLEMMEGAMLKAKETKRKMSDSPCYVSWIKPYKKGRVFYCSPSHNAQSFERPELLSFILNGMQYSLGDLECNDQPVPRPDK